jgi:hypothetical protein
MRCKCLLERRVDVGDGYVQNIEALQQAGAMALLRPLLLDNVPRWVKRSMMRLRRCPAKRNSSRKLCSIQQSAALALGRLANYSDDLAEAVVQNEILPQLVGRADSQVQRN